MENAWTPGPWHVGDEDQLDGIEYVDVHAGRYGHESLRSIAHVQPGFDDDFLPLSDEDRATARLIAAAPILYEKLDQLLRLCKAEPGDSYLMAAMEEARDAILLARGEQRS